MLLCEGLLSSKLNLALLRLIQINVLSVHYCRIFSTSHSHVFTYILSSKTGMRGYRNYWVRAVPRGVKLHEIYIHTHTRLNNLEVKAVGSHGPERATSRLRTPSGEEKTIYLFQFSCYCFSFPLTLTTRPSLDASSTLPLDLIAATKTDTRRESQQINNLAWEGGAEGVQDVKGRRETDIHRCRENGGGKETGVFFPSHYLSLSPSICLLCSQVSGESKGGEVSPAGSWAQRSGVKTPRGVQGPSCRARHHIREDIPWLFGPLWCVSNFNQLRIKKGEDCCHYLQKTVSFI